MPDTELLRRIFHTTLCGMYVYDVPKGRNVYVNRQYTALTGWTLEELNALPPEDFAELFHEDDREAVFKHMADVIGSADDEPLEIEYRFRAKDGRWIWCLSRDAVLDRHPDGSAHRFLGTFMDVTSRREEEEAKHERELADVRTQQVQNLLRMSGGIAHALNNQLATIIGNLELAQLDTEQGDPRLELLSDALVAAGEAMVIGRRMAVLAGKLPTERQTIALSRLLAEARLQLEVPAAPELTLLVELPPEELSVLGSPRPMGELVEQLLRNAVEAVEGRGTVRVLVQQVDAWPSSPTGRVALVPGRPGPYALLSVEDSGGGIAPSELERLFEPFYSTKAPGRGLGLSAARSVVSAHRGGLIVEPGGDGRGATFQVYLPLAVVSPEAAVEGQSAVRPKILVVDDDLLVRRMLRRMLGRLGAEVLEAAGGREALELLASRPGEVDLVLLDLTMPGMSGRQTWTELQRLAPELPVVLISGHDEAMADAEFEGAAPAFIQKPICVDRMRELLSELQGRSG